MRLDLKKKLFGGFSIVLALMIVIAVVTFVQLDINNNLNESAMGRADQIGFLLEKEVDHWFWLSQLADRILTNKEFSGQLDPQKCGFGTWYYEFKDSDEIKSLDPKFQQAFADIEVPHQDLHKSAEKILHVYENQSDEHEAETMAKEIYQNETLANLTTIREDLKAMREIWVEEEENLEVQVEENEASMRIILIVTTVVAIICGFVIAFLVNRGITVPVKTMGDMLKDMAESGGDLTKRVTVSANDEIGDLSKWFNAFLDNLHEIMVQVKQTAETVSAAAAETSMGNQDLSQRTEEQASSLQEISSTIEEITVSLQKSSESSSEADKTSKTTMNTVRTGEQVVGEMQTAMSDITKGSQAIAEIIAKVNDVAFQTNLLALNAAVEAARAGEQGRGFAVVAAEVRNLAGRTAESAKEIEKLIKDSIQRVDRGNELMDEVSRVLGEIVTNTGQTTEVIAQINASMREQSSAAKEIRSAVEQMNQVTQQNASLVEEIAGSSESVSNEAEELATLVSKFKLSVSEHIRNNVKQISRREKMNPPKAGRINSPKGSAFEMAAVSSDYIVNEDDFEKF